MCSSKLTTSDLVFPAALLFAVGQAVGQLSYIRPFVTDFTPGWLLVNTLTLTAGSMVLIHVSLPAVLLCAVQHLGCLGSLKLLLAVRPCACASMCMLLMPPRAA